MQEALGLIAAQGVQGREHRGVFDAFGADPQTQAVGQGDGAGDDAGGAGVAGDVASQGPVELQPGEGQPVEPLPPITWRDIVQVSTGYQHSLGLTVDGRVIATGAMARVFAKAPHGRTWPRSPPAAITVSA